MKKNGCEPLTLVEERVDYSNLVPSGFGTADMIVIGQDETGKGLLHIADFKTGKGVFVDADHNSQLMLYALGALHAYGYIYPIETIRMTIVQPRLDNISTFECSREELEAWGESIRPIAKLAYEGGGEQKCGDWCRFCRAKPMCRACAEEALALAKEEFLDLDEGALTPIRASPEEESDPEEKPEPVFKQPGLIPFHELEEILPTLNRISAWIESVFAFVSGEAINNGVLVKGYKVVEGRSKRVFTDLKAVVDTAMQNGYTDLYKKELIGNAFADYYKNIARYNGERGVWYVYDGKIWRPDIDSLAVSELAKTLADRLYVFALQISDEDTRNRYIKRVQKLQLRKNRKTMIEDAKSVYPVRQKRFDQNTHLFNCQNGTLNLTTGEFRDHNPKDFLTMLSGVTYDPQAVCPRWDQFIQEVMCENQELATYLQKALGYALSGDTRMECLFILYGATSRNGKGTTMETFLKIMGNYGKTSNPEMLSTKFGSSSNASGPSEEIARLAGVRFVNISEPEKKIVFNAALVKRMTGNDTLNARFLHENSFDFKPNFKIFINTNYRPAVSDMTLFDSGRLKIIPFKRHFEESEQDKGLKAMFAEEQNQSAIFNWCYRGYQLFQKEALSDVGPVKEAIAEYHAESDRIGQFVDAWLLEDERYELRTSAVYRRYTEWCEDHKFKPESSTNFNSSIQRFFAFSKKRPQDGGSPTYMLLGCRFRECEAGKETQEDLPVPREFQSLVP